MALLVVDVAGVISVRAQLTTAADAAALAAAPVTFWDFGTGGDPAIEAGKVAEEYGARLVACGCPVDRSWAARQVTVTVVGTVRLSLLGERTLSATSSAEFRPIALGQR